MARELWRKLVHSASRECSPSHAEIAGCGGRARSPPSRLGSVGETARRRAHAGSLATRIAKRCNQRESNFRELRLFTRIVYCAPRSVCVGLWLRAAAFPVQISLSLLLSSRESQCFARLFARSFARRSCVHVHTGHKQK